MFEPVQNRRPFHWKAKTAAAFVFALVAGGAAYLLVPAHHALVPLTGVLHPGDPDFDWYRKYVSLKDPKIRMATNFAGKRILICSGLLENGGEKTLDAVEVELAFFNYEERVWRIMRTPIRPEAASYTPPLAPLEKRGFTFYVEDLPPNWMAGQAELSLTGFRFAARSGALNPRP